MPFTKTVLVLSLAAPALLGPALASPVGTSQELSVRASKPFNIVNVAPGSSYPSSSMVEDVLAQLRGLGLPSVNNIIDGLLPSQIGDQTGDEDPTAARVSPVVVPSASNSGAARPDTIASAPELAQPRFANITFERRNASPLNIKLPTIPTPAIPSLGSSGCPATANNQSNQCSSGIPYCCSPDGDGGHACANGTVACQQTVICCNNFNGMQFCMGDMDFNMPITINLNLGKGGKGGKKSV